jgi:hypothetical protein
LARYQGHSGPALFVTRLPHRHRGEIIVMSTADAEHPAHAPHGVVDQAVNRLFQVGLDLHRALDLVGGRENPLAGQRIRSAIGRVDDTIADLRHAIMPGKAG